MLTRIPIVLDEKTAAGLVALAKQEFRDPRQQAVVIIRQELRKCGLLAAEPVPSARQQDLPALEKALA